MYLIRRYITPVVETASLNNIKIDICWRYVPYKEVSAKVHHFDISRYGNVSAAVIKEIVRQWKG
jgi:hypothetical protein